MNPKLMNKLSFKLVLFLCSFLVVNAQNRVARFDGTDDQIRVPNHSSLFTPNVTSSLTVEAWINASTLGSTTDARTIIGKERENNQRDWVFAHGNGELSFKVYTTSGFTETAVTATTPITTGTWIHVAAVFDGGSNQIRLYVNGAQVGSPTATIGGTIRTETSTANNRRWYIGVINNNNGNGNLTNYFDGDMDEVRIWNTVRTQSQIANNTLGVPTATSNLIAYYTFDSNDASNSSTSAQSGGSSINGTSQNGITYPLDDGPFTYPEITVLDPSETNFTSGSTHTFPVTSIGNNSSAKFTIRNDDTPTLTIDSIRRISGSSDFSLTSLPVDGFDIANGDTTSFVIVFAPTSTGDKTGVIRIYNNDDDEGSFDINLSGTDQINITFTSLPTVSHTSNSRWSMSLGDVTGDGAADLFISGSLTTSSPTPTSSNTMSHLYTNNGSGTFTYDASESFTGTRSNATIMADMDNDGDQDIILSGYVGDGSGHDGIFLNRNDGSGNFTEEIVVKKAFDGWSSQGRVVVADVDNDGDNDIISMGWEGRVNIWYNSDFVAGTWVRSDVIDYTAFPAVIPADFDNDGDIDFVVSGIAANFGSPQASAIGKVYRNNGNNTFTAVNTSINGLGASSGDAADIDGDGDLDFIINGVSGGSYDSGGSISGGSTVTRLYRNNGNFSFTSLSHSIANVSYANVKFGDIDNDGDPDLVVGSSTIYVYTNNGSGTFTQETTLTSNSGSVQIELADIDTDLDLDIVAVGDQIIYTYRNDVNNPNTAPNAPSLVSVIEPLNVDSVYIVWNNGSDNETQADELQYNINAYNNTRGEFGIAAPRLSSNGRRTSPLRGMLRGGTTAIHRNLFYAEESYAITMISVDAAVQNSGLSNSITFVPRDRDPRVILAIPDTSVAENATIPNRYLRNHFQDPDRNHDPNLVFSIVSNTNSSLVTLNINGDYLESTLQTDQYGSSTITIRATANGKSVDDTFVLTVNNQPTAPRFTSSPVTTATQDIPYSYTVVAVDDDNQPLSDAGLTYSAPVLPSWLSFNSTSKVLSGTPLNADVLSSPHNVTLRIFDGTFQRDQSFQISVTDHNDAPVFDAVNDTSVFEDSLYTRIVSATDPDGHSLTYSALTLPAWASFNAATRTVSGTPLNSHIGTDTVMIRVTDAALHDTLAYNITVVNTNDSVNIAAIGNQNVNEDDTLSVTVNFTDPDPGDSHLITINSSNVNILIADSSSLTTSGQSFSIIPNPNYVGTSTITVSVRDALGWVSQEVFTLTVDPVNDAPTVTSTAITSATEGLAYSYTVTAVDSDNVPVSDAGLTFSAPTLPSWLSFNTTTRILSGTPGNGQVGAHSVVIRVTDGSSPVDHSFTVTVSNTNDQPYFTSTAITSATEDVLYSYTVLASDSDLVHGDNLTLTAPTLPSWLSFNAGTGLLSGTPRNGDVGNHSVLIRATDDSASFANHSFTITVTGTNDPPTITSTPSDSVNQGVLYSYTITAVDSDNVPVSGAGLSYSAPTLPSWLSFNSGTRLLSGTPSNGDVGTHNVVLRVTDGALSTDQVFTVTVVNQNDPPSFTSSPVTTATENVLYTYNITTNDPDIGDNVNVSFITIPAWIDTVDLGGGLAELTGIPDDQAVATGSHPVVIRATDNSGAFVEQSFTITVSGVNDVPVVLSSPVDTVLEGNLYTYTIVAVDSDNVPPSSSGLTFTRISGPTNANLVGNVLSWTPTIAQSDQLHFFRIRVSDGTANVNHDFNIFVKDTNLIAPLWVDFVTDSATENVAYRDTLRAFDTDGDSVIYSQVSLPAWLSFDGDSILSGTPGNVFVGNHTVIVRASDGSFSRDTTYNVFVRNVNDPPVITSTAITSATEDQLYTYVLAANDSDGNTLSWTAPTLPSWLSFNSSTRTLSGTPLQADLAGSPHAVTIQVDDGNSGTDQQSFSITITPFNDQPVFTAINDTSINEGTTYNFTFNATDEEGPLSFTATTLPSWLTATPTNGGTSASILLNGAPHNGDVGNHTVSLRASDGVNSVTRTFTITVVNVNDAPYFTSTPTDTTTEDILYTYNILVADSDHAVGSLTVSAPTLPSFLTYNNVLKRISGTPSNADVGNHPVVVQVSDGSLTTQQNFTLVVLNSNDAPVFAAINDTTINESVAYSRTFSATDPDLGDVLTWSAPTLPAWMAFNTGTQTLTGTPDDPQIGSHSVTIRVSDGTVNVDRSFTITVANVNDNPVIVTTPSDSVNEDSFYTYTISATDADVGDSLSYSAPVLPSWLSFNSATRVLSGTPTNANVGVHNVTLRVSDGTVNVNQAFTVTVVNVNDPPVFNSVPVTIVTENYSYNYTATATDDDGDALTFDAPVLPAFLTFNPGTRLLSGTPGDQYVGTHAVQLRVYDGTVYVTQNFSVTVYEVNDPPVITSTAITSATEDILYSYTVTAVDSEDVTPLIFSQVSLPSWLSFNTSTQLLSGTPRDADVGNHTVIIRVTDDSLAFTDHNFTVNVTGVNDDPVFLSSPVTSVNENTTYTYTVIATDSDNVPPSDAGLTWSAPTLPAWLSFNTSTHVLTGTPGNSFVGSHNVVIRVFDGTTNVDQSFSITVNNTNDAPVITSTAITTATEDILYSYTITATDSDASDILTYSAPTLPSWLSFNNATRILSGTPGQSDVGAHSVTLRVNDGTVNVDQNFTVTVSNVNDNPVIVTTPDTTVNEDSPYLYTINATDDDGDGLTYTAPVLPAWLTFNSGTRVLSGTPLNAHVGIHNVTLRVNDGTVNVDQVYTIRVINTNDAPSFTTSPVTSAQNGVAYNYTAAVTDPDVGDVLTLSAPTLPSWLSFNAGTGLLNGTPSGSDVGSHGVVLRVTDGTVNIFQSFTITVTNSGPSFTSSPVTTATEDVLYSYTVQVTDPDDPPASLTITAITVPSWATWNGGTLTLSGTPLNADVGTDSVRFSVTDGNETAFQAFVVTVNNTNDSPQITSTPITTATEDIAYSYTFSATDIDVGDVIQYFATTLPSWLSFNQGSGLLNGTPLNGDDGNHNVVLNVTDGTDTLSQAFTIAVTAVNDAPVFVSVSDTSIQEDIAYSKSILANDVDNTPAELTYSFITQPSWLNLTGTNLNGTPLNAHVGIHPVSIRVVDSGAPNLADTLNFNITVTNINDAPQITSTAITTATEDIAYSYTVTASDDENDPLTYTAPILPSWLSFNSTTQIFSGTPVNSDVGAHNVQVVVNDGLATDTQSFVITVNNVNDPPVFVSVNDTTINEGLAYSQTITASDVDGPATTIILITDTTGLWYNVNITNGVNAASVDISGTPGNSDIGSFNFQARVTDGSLSDTVSYTITVNNVNDSPQITSTAITTATEDILYSYTITATDPDLGDVLTFSAPVLPSWLTFNPGTRLLSGTARDAQVGTHNVTLRVTDGSINVNQNFTITVTNVNDTPVITSSPATSITEDNLYTYTITALDSDNVPPSAAGLTFIGATIPSWMTFNPGTQLLSGTPTNSEVGVHGVLLRVTDGTDTVNQSFNVTVINDNDQPTFSSVNDTTILEDVAFTKTITASDVDGPATTITMITDTTGKWYNVNITNGVNSASIVISGTPANSEVGLHVIQMRVSDGVLSQTLTYNVTVSNVNDAPYFTSSPTLTVNEDALYSYTANASDDDGDSLAFTAPVLPSWLSFNTSTRILSGTPVNSNVGAHAVTIRVFDGTDSTDQSFSITVNNTNDEPVFASINDTTILEDAAYSRIFTATDPDVGDVLTWSAPTLPSWMSFNTGTQTLTGTPTNNEVGIHNVTIRVFDGTTSVNRSFTITVTNTNDSPSFTTAPNTTANVGLLYSYTVSATDPDIGDVLTYSQVAIPSWATFNAGTRVLSGTPALADTGSFAVTLRVNDGTVNVDQSFTITVVNNNTQAPVFISAPLTTVNEDQLYTYTASATDADTHVDSLNWSAPGLPAWLNFNSSTKTVSGIPRNADVGSHSITIRVNDGNVNVDQNYTLTVTNTNDAPYFVTTALDTAIEDQSYNFVVLASDSDLATTLTYSAPTLPSWLSFTPASRTLSGTPLNADVGNNTVVISVNDGDTIVSQTFNLFVQNTNDQPNITSTPLTTATEDILYTYTITATDPDLGDSLTYTAPTIAPWLSFNSATRQLSGTPLNAHVGNHNIVLRVSDGTSSVDQNFTITVTNTNDAPVFTSAADTTAIEDVLYSYTVSATDPDIGDVLTFSAQLLPSWLTFNTGTRVLSGTATNTEVGSHNVVIRVSDGTVNVEQSFTIVVVNSNDAPVFTSTPLTSATEDLLYQYVVTAVDSDNVPLSDAGLTYSIITDTTGNWFKFDATTHTLSGTPLNADVGSQQIRLRIADAFGAMVDQVFTITIANTNDKPEFLTTPIDTINEDSFYSYNFSVVDPDGDSFSLTTNTLPSFLSFDSLGSTISGTPTNADVGDHMISIFANDGTGNVQQTYILTVLNTNDAPTFTTSPITSADEDTLYQYTVSATDIDVGDSLSYTAPTLPSWLSFNPVTRLLSGTPRQADVGSHSVVLRVTDKSLVSVNQSFTITVANTNDDPVFISTAPTAATEDLVYTYNILIRDDDSDAQIITAPTLPSWLTLSQGSDTTATLSGTPLNSHVGSHSVTLRTSDGTTNVDQSFTIVVANVNDAPQIVSVPNTSATEDLLYTYTISASDVDAGATLTYSAPTLPSWLSFNTSTRVLSGTPLNAHVGNHNVILQVSDGIAPAVQQSFTITVSNTNDPPVFVNQNDTSTNEDLAFGLVISVSDPDGDGLTLTAPTLPSWLSFNSGTRTLSGTPLNADVGIHNVIIRANDGTVNQDLSFNITVVNTNDAPVFVSTPNTNAFDNVAYSYTANATDVDAGATLTYSNGTLPGWLAFNTSTQVLSGTPLTADTGSYAINLFVTDGIATDTQSFTINVIDINTSAPLITSSPDTTVLENSIYSYVLTATDSDVGDVLTYSAITVPAWASFNTTTRELSGTPGNDFVGSHNVVLRVSDGVITTDQSFSIRVINTNDIPVITSTPLDSVLEDNFYTYTIAANDSDLGTILSYSSPTLPSWLNFNPVSRVLSGTPTNSNLGVHAVSLRVNDGFVNVDQNFNITVVNTNDAPVFVSSPDTSAVEDQLYSYTFSAVDVDPSTILIYSVPTKPSWLNYNASTRTLSATPTNAEVGSYPVVIRVTDGIETVDQNFTLHVANTNDAPLITSSPNTTATQDILYSYTLNATDDDTDSLSYRSAIIPSWLSFNQVTRLLSGVPTNSDVGVHSISLYVTDGIDSTYQNFSLTVNNVNDRPTIISSPDTTATEDLLYSYIVSATDIDGDSLTYTVPNKPAWLNFNSGTRQLSGIPDDPDVGLHNVTVRVNDGTVDVDQAFSIFVLNVNDTPEVTSVPITVATEDVPYSYTMTVKDDDKDTLYYLLSTTLPSWATFNTATGLLSGTPRNADVGVHDVTLRVTDTAFVVDQNFKITVFNTNDAPTIDSSPDTLATEDILYSYNFNASDVDVGDSLIYTVTTKPAWLSFNVNTQVLSGIPTNSDVGTHAVTIRVSDGVEQLEQSFTVRVQNSNDAPVFTSAPITGATENLLYSYTVQATDVDAGTTLTFSAPSIPSWLSFNPGTRVLTGTPLHADVGDHAITLRVTDGIVNVNQNFTITVTDVNNAPVIVAIANDTIAEDLPYSLTVSASDADADILNFYSPTKPSWLNFDAPTRVFSGTPLNADVGLHTVVLRVEDGFVTSEETFTLLVTNVNDAPTVTVLNDTTVLEKAAFNFTYTAVDVDLGDVLTDSLYKKPVWMSYNKGTRTFSGTPYQAHVGSDSLHFSVSDGDVEVHRQVLVTVQNVNDQPYFTNLNDTSINEDLAFNLVVAAADSDDVSLTITAGTIPSWLSFNPGTSVLSGTPTNSDVGAHSVTMNVNDGKVTVQKTITITVINVNDSPVISSTPDTISVEKRFYSYQLITSDPDGNPLTVTFAGHDSLSYDSVNYVISFTPSASLVDSTLNARFEVTDGIIGAPVVQEFRIHVLDSNANPPQFASIPPTSINEDDSLNYIVSVFDADLPNDTITFALTTKPSWVDGITKTGINSAVLKGLPTNNNIGDTTIVIAATDDSGRVATQSFVITVVNTNDAPVLTAVNDTIAIEDSLFTVTMSATDVDPSETLTYSAVSTPSWLSFNSASRVFSGTPTNANVADSQRVIWSVNDTKVIVRDTFYINVQNVNDAPQIVSGPVTNAQENNFYQYQVIATDAENDTISYGIVNNLGWLSVNSNRIEGTPANEHVGSFPVRIWATDKIDTTYQDYTLTVSNVNSAPFYINPISTDTVTEDTHYSYIVNAADPDSNYTVQTLTYTLITKPSWIVFNSSTREISSSPDPANDKVGNHNITIRVSDGISSTDMSYVLTVTNTNDAPQIITTPDTVAIQDQLYSMPMTATDVDPTGDNITWALLSPPAGMSIVLNSGLITWTPDQNANLLNTIQVVASDNHGAADTVAYNLHLRKKPRFLEVLDTIKFNEEVITQTKVRYIDENDTNPSFNFTSTTGNIAYSGLDSDSLMTVTPSLNYFGNSAVTVRITNKYSLSASQRIPVQVLNINDTPVFGSVQANHNVLQNQNFSYQLTASDADPGDILTYSANSLPAWLTINPTTGLMTGTPSQSHVGTTYNFNVMVTDNNLASDTASLSIQAIDIQEAPVFTSIPKDTVLEGGTYQYTVKAFDPEGDSFSFVVDVDSIPSWTEFIADSSLNNKTGRPARADVGTHNVTIKARDSFGNESAQRFTIRVIQVNQAPVIVNSDTTAYLRQEFSDVISADDIDGDNFDFSMVRPLLPTWMDTVRVDNKTFRITGNPDYAHLGVDTIQFVANDGQLVSDLAFSVTIRDSNYAPEILSNNIGTSITVNQGANFSRFLTATDLNRPVDSLFIVESSLPSVIGYFTETVSTGARGIDTTRFNLIGKDLNQSAVGSQLVNVVVSDGRLTDTLSFTLNVNDVNDDPFFTSTPLYETKEDTVYNYSLTAMDVDDPQSSLSFIADRLPAWASLVNGVVTGTPAQADVDTHRVIVRVTDGRGGQDRQSFLINVKNTNDVPVLQAIPDTTITDNELFTYTVQANDPDNDKLSYSVTGASWVSIDSIGKISATASASDAGQHLIQVTANDGEFNAQQSFVLTVQANTAPVFVNRVDTLYALEGAAFTFTFIGFDANGDAVKISLANLPAWLSYDNVATINGTPLQANVGSQTISVTFNDGKVDNEYDIVLLVRDDPNPPQLLKSFDDLRISNQEPYVIDLSTHFTDPDGDALTYKITSDNPDVGFVIPTGTSNLIINRDNRDLLVDNARVYIDVEDASGLTLPTQEFGLTVFDGKNVRLEQNYPNPFTNKTTFRFNLKEDATISLSIYTLNGKLVKDIIKNKAYKGGYYTTEQWDGTDNNGNKLPAGIYYMILTSSSDIISKKFTIIR